MPATFHVLGASKPVEVPTSTSFGREIIGGDPPTELIWATHENMSVPLEIIIQVETIAGGSLNHQNLPDQLRWQIFNMGHGETAYELAPNMAQLAGAGAGAIQRYPQWAIPARGVVARVQARSLKVAIVNNNASSSAFIRASINPLSAPDSDRWPFPLADFQNAGTRCFFPLGAREWRLQPAGINDLVDIYGFAASEAAAPAAYLMTRPVTDFWDWRLIAHREYSWIVTANGVAAQYR